MHFSLDKKKTKYNITLSQIWVLNLAAQVGRSRVRSYRRGLGPVQISVLYLCRLISGFSALIIDTLTHWQLMEERTLAYPTHTAQPAQEIRFMPSGRKLAFCNL